MRTSALGLMWLLLASIAPAQAQPFTVGSDAMCTHDSVLAAVLAAGANGPGEDEIRVAFNQNHDGVIAPVVGQNLRVRGGYSDCSDTVPTGRTVLNGTPSGANGTFSTSGTASAYQLVLEDIELRAGGNDTRRGGALRIDGRFTVELRNVIISGNRAGRGGGVYLDGSDGAGLTLTARSSIEDNSAFVGGGGLYCQDGGVVLLVSGSVRDNSAENGGADVNESGNGGGVALNACTMIQAGDDGAAGVQGNVAARHGGGYYLRNGAQLTLQGSGTSAARVVQNEAASTGGGIAVNDILPSPPGGISAAYLYNAWVDSNRANSGGGIGLLAGGDITMQRTLPGNTCHNATFCSSLSFNEKTSAASSCLGAALFAGEASQVRLRNTIIEENCLSDGGWAIRQRLDSRLQIDSSIISANGGASPFFIDGGGVTVGGLPGFTGLLEVAWSTVTGHFESVRASLLAVPSSSPGSTGTARIFGSVLGEPFLAMTTVGGPGSAPPMTLDFDCLVLDSVYDGSSATIRSIETSFPYGMVNPAAGNYRPASATAVMVDVCDMSRGPRVAGDADGNAIISNTPTSDVYGPRDLGAYEFPFDATVSIFANGFE